MVIIGITGSLGAGKGEVVAFLKKKGFSHFSARAFIVADARRLGISVDRDSIIRHGNELRKQGGPGYIIEHLHREAVRNGSHSVIESVRAVGEIAVLRKNPSFRLLAVTADPTIRYERICRRGSELDSMTHQEFLAFDSRELSSDDPFEQNLTECTRQADFSVANDGSIQDLHMKLEGLLDGLLENKSYHDRHLSSVGRALLS